MINILYVDDEEDLLHIGKIFLEKNSEFKVDTASTAEHGIQMISKKNYDAIISDYEMPISNGIEFLKKINDKTKNIPFIIFTGKGREEVAIEALNNGAKFYIQKGGDPKSQFAELSSKVRIAVNEKRLISKHKSIYNLTIKMVTEEILQDSLDLIAESITKILNTDASFILLINKENGKLEYCTSYGINEQFKDLTLSPSEGIGWKVLTDYKGLIIENYLTEDSFEHAVDVKVKEEGIISAMAAPLQIKQKSFGVLYAVSKTKRRFKKRDLETLSLFGNLAAIAIIKDLDKKQVRLTANEINKNLFIVLELIDILKGNQINNQEKNEHLEKIKTSIHKIEKEIEGLIIETNQ